MQRFFFLLCVKEKEASLMPAQHKSSEQVQGLILVQLQGTESHSDVTRVATADHPDTLKEAVYSCNVTGVGSCERDIPTTWSQKADNQRVRLFTKNVIGIFESKLPGMGRKLNGTAKKSGGVVATIFAASDGNKQLYKITDAINSCVVKIWAAPGKYTPAGKTETWYQKLAFFVEIKEDGDKFKIAGLTLPTNDTSSSSRDKKPKYTDATELLAAFSAAFHEVA